MTVFQSKITAEDCDLYDHMNTMKYLQKFYDAADLFMLEYGFSDPILAEKGLGCAYLEFNTKFIKEVFEGDEVAISVKVQEKGAKVITILLEMHNRKKEKVSEVVLKLLFFDLVKRKSVKIEDCFLKDVF